MAMHHDMIWTEEHPLPAQVSKFYKGMESILGPKMQRAAASVQERAKAGA